MRSILSCSDKLPTLASDSVCCYWRETAIVDNDVRCPSELSANRSNVTEAEQFLRWRAHVAMPDVVDAMVPAQANRLREA